MSSTFIPCRYCANKPGPFPGFYYVVKDNVRYVAECNCHKEWNALQTLERKLIEANLWPDLDYDPEKHYKGLKSAKEVRNLITYVDNFETKFFNKMIYMTGTNGTQKTTLAMWVGKELIKKGKSVYYTLMENLTISLSPDFSSKDNDDARKRLVDKALSADLLIVDESFDRSKMTLYKSGYQIPLLDSFLRNRFDIEKKGILFISNKAPDTLAANGFGESLHNFIVRNTRGSVLIFKDEYIKEANVIDVKGLFE